MPTEVTRNYVNTPSARHNFDLTKNELWKWGSGNHNVHHLAEACFISLHLHFVQKNAGRLHAVYILQAVPNPAAPRTPAAHLWVGTLGRLGKRSVLYTVTRLLWRRSGRLSQPVGAASQTSFQSGLSWFYKVIWRAKIRISCLERLGVSKSIEQDLLTCFQLLNPNRNWFIKNNNYLLSVDEH